MQSVAIVNTAQAQRYLGQFCKHFAHRLKVEQAEDNASGVVNFDNGICRLVAGHDQLELSVDAQTEDDILRLQDVVARHLLRFAFREDLAVSWEKAGSPTALSH